MGKRQVENSKDMLFNDPVLEGITAARALGENLDDDPQEILETLVAVCLECGLRLVTFDQGFQRFPNLYCQLLKD